MQISANDWQKYVSKLSAINTKAGELLQAYIDKHGLNDIESVITYAHALVTKYGEAGSELSCQMYDALAAAQGAYVNPAEPASIANRHEVAGALLKTQGTLNMIPAIERLVKTAASDTMLKNAKRDNAEWAWVSHGDTCAFCMHLSSLGWMPASKAILRGEHAEHIHANCDCEFAIRFDGKSSVEGYDPHKFKLIYDSADGKTSLDKLNAIRRQMYPKIKEERNAKRRHLLFLEKIDDSLDEAKTNLLQNIQKGNITTKINPEKQSKHLMNSWDGKSSVFDGDLNDVQKMINHDIGSGIVYEKQNGKQYKEIIVKEYEIGYNVREENVLNQRTDRYAIHYSRNRTHATPISPSSKKGKTE